MKKIVVLADTHGNFSVIDKLLPIINESDYCIHLGDYQRDIMAFKGSIKVPLISVKGNCDMGEDEELLDIEGAKILVTHGHKYNVKITLTQLYLRAKELGANAVFFGHTHEPLIVEEEGIQLINPGCMTRFSDKTYCYCVVHEKKITAKIVNVE